MSKMDAFRSVGLSHKMGRSEFSSCPQSSQVNVDIASRNVAFYGIMSQITIRPFRATFLVVFH